MKASFMRELRAYFTSPIGYVVLAFSWLMSGYSFHDLYTNATPEIGYIFQQMFIIVLFIIPIITMRLLSEDRRQKTDQVLLTAPVNLSAIVLGKFLSALALYLYGGASMEGLAETHMIGAVIVVLSSILVAVPMLTIGFLRVSKQDLLPKAKDVEALARRP